MIQCVPPVLKAVGDLGPYHLCLGGFPKAQVKNTLHDMESLSGKEGHVRD